MSAELHRAWTEGRRAGAAPHAVLRWSGRCPLVVGSFPGEEPMYCLVSGDRAEADILG
jgi:hypothetical protein